MKATTASAMAMLPATSLAQACGTAYPANEVDGTLVNALVIDMGSDAANITASQYDQYFSQGSAVDGVKAVLAAGNFYINLWAIPGSEDAYQNNTACAASGGYLVNQTPWLAYTNGTWYGGYEAETAEDSFADAALAVANGLIAGLEVRFWDIDGDGFTDLIDADFLEGVTVDTVTENANGTYTIYRGNIDVANKTPYEGTIFDQDLFASTTTGPTIPAENFDTTVGTGDVALFWYGPNGWAMKRAEQIEGIFIDGADHEFYEIDGVTYEDAMRFSRDNLFISNRPGETTSAQKYFGLTNNTAAGLDVSLWLVPVSNIANTSEHGAPIGMTTSLDDGRAFLTSAIEQCQAALDNVTVSADGSDVPSTQEWITQGNYTILSDAIARANSTVAAADSSSFLLSYQLYLLYQAMDGSADDIGAMFAGFSFTGFVNEVAYGTAA